jgi:hypothetical protein
MSTDIGGREKVMTTKSKSTKWTLYRHKHIAKRHPFGSQDLTYVVFVNKELILGVFGCLLFESCLAFWMCFLYFCLLLLIPLWFVDLVCVWLLVYQG